MFKKLVHYVKLNTLAAYYCAKVASGKMDVFNAVVELLVKMGLDADNYDVYLVSNFDYSNSNSRDGLAYSKVGVPYSIFFVKEKIDAIVDTSTLFNSVLYIMVHEMRHNEQFLSLAEQGYTYEDISNYILSTPYQDNFLEKDAYAFADKFLKEGLN